MNLEPNEPCRKNFVPRKLRKKEWLQSLFALSLVGPTPYFDSSRPIKTIGHSKWAQVKFLRSNRLTTFSKFQSWVSWSFPCAAKSSAMFWQLSVPAKACLTICWYISRMQLTPNINLLYRKRPSCVVMSRDLECSSSSVWWNPKRKSSFEYTVLLFKLSDT